MKRGLVIAIGGSALVVASLSGCSSNDKSTSAATTTSKVAVETTTVSVTASATAAPGAAKVTIDGQDQNVQGTVACTTTGENVVIGIGDQTAGIGVTVGTGDPPVVHQVGLGNVNGVTLAFQEGVPGDANATATKDGNTYKITGVATGIDMANPMQPVNKPFEIEVSCP